MIEIDFESMNDTALKFLLDIQRVNLEDRKRAVAETEAMIKRAEAELARRELEAYWQANPTLTRVADGDKVLVTAESKSMGDSDPVGTVNTVKGKPFKFHNEVGFMVSLDGSWGEVFREIGVVIRMREAYLKAESKKPR